MLPGLGQFIIAIVGACLLVGLVSFLGEKKDQGGKAPLNPIVTMVLVVLIIIFFVGYLMI